MSENLLVIMSDSEADFRDTDERLAAMSAHFGLCTWLNSNFGQILEVLQASGQGGRTTVVYPSDHR